MKLTPPPPSERLAAELGALEAMLTPQRRRPDASAPLNEDVPAAKPQGEHADAPDGEDNPTPPA